MGALRELSVCGYELRNVKVGLFEALAAVLKQ